MLDSWGQRCIYVYSIYCLYLFSIPRLFSFVTFYLILMMLYLLIFLWSFNKVFSIILTYVLLFPPMYLALTYRSIFQNLYIYSMYRYIYWEPGNRHYYALISGGKYAIIQSTQLLSPCPSSPDNNPDDWTTAASLVSVLFMQTTYNPKVGTGTDCKEEWKLHQDVTILQSQFLRLYCELCVRYVCGCHNKPHKYLDVFLWFLVLAHK